MRGGALGQRRGPARVTASLKSSLPWTSSPPFAASRLTPAARAKRITLLRCAPPKDGGVAAASSDEHADEGVDPDELLAAQLEEVERERVRFREIATAEKNRENDELERRSELEAVAESKAQFAVKAWEDHAQAEVTPRNTLENCLTHLLDGGRKTFILFLTISSSHLPRRRCRRRRSSWPRR